MNGYEHFQGPGGVMHSPASNWAKEMACWETVPRADGSVTQQMIDTARRAGVHHGTFDHQEFPKAMYHATQTPTGIKLDTEPDGRLASVSAHSPEEQRNLESRGFASSQAGAIAVVEEANQAAAVAAANRAFHDRRMTAAARAEAEAIDSRVARHLGEIPEARRPGRRKRIAVPAAAEGG